MGKPSIGAALTPELERERKQETMELTVLNDNSKESIYNMVFSEAENGTRKENEQ